MSVMSSWKEGNCLQCAQHIPDTAHAALSERRTSGRKLFALRPAHPRHSSCCTPGAANIRKETVCSAPSTSQTQLMLHSRSDEHQEGNCLQCAQHIPDTAHAALSERRTSGRKLFAVRPAHPRHSSCCTLGAVCSAPSTSQTQLMLHSRSGLLCAQHIPDTLMLHSRSGLLCVQHIPATAHAVLSERFAVRPAHPRHSSCCTLGAVCCAPNTSQTQLMLHSRSGLQCAHPRHSSCCTLGAVCSAPNTSQTQLMLHSRSGLQCAQHIPDTAHAALSERRTSKKTLMAHKQDAWSGNIEHF